MIGQCPGLKIEEQNSWNTTMCSFSFLHISCNSNPISANEDSQHGFKIHVDVKASRVLHNNFRLNYSFLVMSYLFI